MTTKASIVDHEHLLKRFNVFSGVENIKAFKEIYLPKLESWEREILDLMNSNEEVRKCIIQFDHDMTLKCNKSALLSFKHELDCDYVPISEK